MATIALEKTKHVGYEFFENDTKHEAAGITIDFFWEAMGDDDNGFFAATSGMADKTVTITGTIGAGTIVIEGSNDGTNWFTLTNAKDGEALSFTVLTAAMAVILENPLYMRPTTAGGSSNDMDVHIAARLTV